MKKPKRVRNHVNPLAYRDKYFFDGFNNNKEIIVDIGSYRGEFGERLLEKFGDSKNFIFFEIREVYKKYLEEKFSDKKNVKIFGGNAGMNLKNVLLKSINNEVKIEKIFINFPDPWFKKRHHKRRVVNKYFLDDLKDWIKTETEIIFQTDQKELFDWTLDLVKNDSFYDFKIFDRPFWNIRTYWEEMKIKDGKEIYRFVFWKK